MVTLVVRDALTPALSRWEREEFRGWAGWAGQQARRAKRKPTPSCWASGLRMPRLADREFLPCVLQHPPRRIRWLPSFWA